MMPAITGPEAIPTRIRRVIPKWSATASFSLSMSRAIRAVQARAVGRHQQGAVVGLRQTGQRLTSIVIPPLMGAIADRWGVSESFFVLGALMLLLCLPLALLTRHAARATSRSKAEPTLAD